MRQQLDRVLEIAVQKHNKVGTHGIEGGKLGVDRAKLGVMVDHPESVRARRNRLVLYEFRRAIGTTAVDNSDLVYRGSSRSLNDSVKSAEKLAQIVAFVERGK
jgi:hypothetical protein